MYRLPCRMNDTKVVFELFGRANITTVDSDYREVKGNRNFRKVELIGQLVGARSWFRLDRRQTGDSEPSSGALVFRPSVLAKAGVTLQKGDRIIEMSKVAVDFNVIKVAPMAPLRGGTLLISVEYEQQRKQKESV